MSSGSPCGACKFLRRKCIKGCIFAPYFLSEQGTESFCAVHKVFGASNVSKLLMRIPLPEQRREAVFTIKYEAQARLKDPIYGCVGTIFTLERQVEYLQAELQFVRAQLSSQLAAAWYNHQQQQQELQPIATAPSSPAIPCGSLPLLSVNAPVGSSWCMPHITSPSSCANGARKVDESAQMSAANCILEMSNSNLEALTSLQLLDTLQRNQLALEQRDFVNEAELQALAQALLQRN